MRPSSNWISTGFHPGPGRNRRDRVNQRPARRHVGETPTLLEDSGDGLRRDAAGTCRDEALLGPSRCRRRTGECGFHSRCVRLATLLATKPQGTFLSAKSFLSALLPSLTISLVQATLTSKGQITIPVHVRNRLRLKPGDVLEFDETAPFLKATKTIPAEAWEQFGKAATDPWVGMSVLEVMDELRGPVEPAAAEQP